jgi:hypothetical protein
VYVGPDSAFLSNPIELNWTEDTEGVDQIDYVFDVGQPTATVTVHCRASRWQLHPGTSVNLTEVGIPNPWLVQTIQRDLFDVDCDVTLMTPEPALPEPEADAGDGAVDEDYLGALLGLLDPDATKVDTGGTGDWKWPVAGDHKINSPFGKRNGRMHEGIDINVSQGSPVYASRAGTVTQAGNFNPTGYGNAVYLSHRPTGTDNVVGPVAASEESRYGHLSKIIVARGVSVRQGDLIGLSGGQPGTPGAGDANGPHLHFEIRKKGSPVDPLPYLDGRIKGLTQTPTAGGGGGGGGDGAS